MREVIIRQPPLSASWRGLHSTLFATPCDERVNNFRFIPGEVIVLNGSAHSKWALRKTSESSLIADVLKKKKKSIHTHTRLKKTLS